ncbi:MAG: DUF3823 domain-containing protein [Bacteroidales bacterium]|nr:DUF3823 domain-containing protein [Bacteroidales bacterium]MBQ7459140.1 DUF3823 domain-containing protein [Bacteroidales bacterium]
MKRLFIYIFAAVLMASCSVFEIDNYEQPEETICGNIVDAYTGELIQTEQNGRGIRVRLTELSYGPNVTHNPDFYARDNGTYQNTKLFKGFYNVRIDGPFVPIVRETPEGDTIFNGTVDCRIEGITQVHFRVQPFLRVEIVGDPEVSGGKITAQVRVTRGTSEQEFREAIEPMGNYKPEYLNVTDVRLYVGYSATCNGDNKYEAWSNVLEYEGSAFEPYLGQILTISSRGTVKPNRKVFIRAAARINYATPVGGERRYNFSEVREVNIP